MKISHSGLSTASSCGMKYKYSYVDKLTSIWKGSALPFGSAMDGALNFMLLNKDKECLEDSLAVFRQEWSSQKERNGTLTLLENNQFLEYSDSDFDEELLQDQDKQKLAELYGPEFMERFETLAKSKKQFRNFAAPDRQFYNHVNWFSLLRKGEVMVKTYFQYVLPEIHEVLDVQKHIELGNGTPDTVHGYVDFVIRMKDGRVAVMDNKTTSVEYTEDAAQYSPQLALYKIILNSMNLPYTVTHTGYVTLSKKLNKNKVKICKSCGYEAEPGTTHKKCNNDIEGRRCNGEWAITVSPSCDYQILISQPSEKFEEDLLTNVNTLNTIISNKLFVKNMGSCKAYGRDCDFKRLCFDGDTNDRNLKLKE
jgi:hypothetical protein